MAFSFHEKPTILLIVLLCLLVVITPSLFADSSAQKYSIPNSIKETVKLWGYDDTIADSNFKQGLQWMIQNNIIVLSEEKTSSGSDSQHIPMWVRNDAKWWADDQITDSDFVQGMQYLIQIGTINMQTPAVNNPPPIADTTPPVITLLGSNPVTVQVGSSYTDAGAVATDDVDGILTSSIITSNQVNTSVAGTYTVTYNVKDAAGNFADAIRIVNVVAPTPNPVPPPTYDGFDKWGIKMLNPTIASGREWFSAWDNGVSRTITVGNRDPYDPTGWFKVTGEGSGAGIPKVIVDGSGTATMSGTEPRMYVYDPTQKLKWLNTEVTVYSKRINETLPSSTQGINIGARSNHQDQGNGNKCHVDTYYSRILYNGYGNFAKELQWPTDVKKPSSIFRLDWKAFGNVTLPNNIWIGHKFVLRNVDGGTHVNMEMWRDLTDGLNGGDWKLMLSYTDKGNMTVIPTGTCPTTDLSHIILEANPSIFIRNTYINATQYKEFSAREIDPLP